MPSFAAQKPFWQRHPPPHSTVGVEQSLRHRTALQSGAFAAAPHAVARQHVLGAQSSSVLHASLLTTRVVDPAGGGVAPVDGGVAPVGASVAVGAGAVSVGGGVPVLPGAVGSGVGEGLHAARPRDIRSAEMTGWIRRRMGLSSAAALAGEGGRLPAELHGLSEESYFIAQPYAVTTRPPVVTIARARGARARAPGQITHSLRDPSPSTEAPAPITLPPASTPGATLEPGPS